MFSYDYDIKNARHRNNLLGNVKYEDGTEELVPIEPLGHDVTGTLTFDAEHKEHYDTCSRCGRVAEEE